MAFSTKAGSFATGTGAGGTTVAVTGVGFVPKVLIFWWGGLPNATDATSSSTNIRRGYGVVTSTTSRWAIGTQSVDAAATSDTDRIQREDACVATVTAAGAVDGLLDHQSFDADGFTLVVDDQFAVSVRVHYMALGGSDLTNAATGRWDVPAATGNEDITSVGFQPDFVLFGSINSATDPPSISTAADIMIGAAASSSQQAVLFNRSLNAQTTMDTYAYSLAGECIAYGTGPNVRGTFSSFLSNGFRINWLEVVATNITYYLALKGGSYRVDNFLTSTSNGATITETGFGFTPKGALLVSHGRAADTADTYSAHDQRNVGAFTSTTERLAMGSFDVDAVADSQIELYVEYDQALGQLTAAPAVVGLVDVQSIDSDGFTLVMESAANPAAFVWYVAFGDQPAVTPVAIAAVAALPTPAILAESLVTPAAISVVAALPTPVAQISAVVTPAVIAVVAALPIPSVSALANVSPAVVAVVAALPTPAILAAAKVAPTVIPVVIALPTPTVIGGAVGLVTPAVIVAGVTLPTPTPKVEALVTPAGVTLVVTIPTPSVGSPGLATPAGVSLIVTLPTPGQTSGDITFWSKDPVGFVKVGPGDQPPWN